MVHNLNGLLEFGYFLGHYWSEMERIEAVVVVGLYHHTYWKAQTEIHYLLEQIEVADSTYSLQLVGEEAVKFFGLDSLYLEVVRRLAAVVFFRPRWVVLVGARKAAIPALAAVYFHMGCDSHVTNHICCAFSHGMRLSCDNPHLWDATLM